MDVWAPDLVFASPQLELYARGIPYRPATLVSQLALRTPISLSRCASLLVPASMTSHRSRLDTDLANACPRLRAEHVGVSADDCQGVTMLDQLRVRYRFETCDARRGSPRLPLVFLAQMDVFLRTVAIQSATSRLPHIYQTGVVYVCTCIDSFARTTKVWTGYLLDWKW